MRNLKNGGTIHWKTSDCGPPHTLDNFPVVCVLLSKAEEKATLDSFPTDLKIPNLLSRSKHFRSSILCSKDSSESSCKELILRSGGFKKDSALAAEPCYLGRHLRARCRASHRDSEEAKSCQERRRGGKFAAQRLRFLGPRARLTVTKS